jgi:L-fuconolactonase
LFLLKLAERHDTIKRLNFFSKFQKLRGLRHIVQAEPDDQFMLRQAFVLRISRLSEFTLSYDILVYPRQWPAVIGLVDKFPGQRFVVDHVAKPPNKTHKIRLGGRHRKTSRGTQCLLQALRVVTEADGRNWDGAQFRPYLDVVFEAFGCERLMFGSDWPVCLLAGTYCQVKEAVEHFVRELPTQQREAIFALNAARFSGLQQSHHGLAAC